MPIFEDPVPFAKRPRVAIESTDLGLRTEKRRAERESWETRQREREEENRRLKEVQRARKEVSRFFCRASFEERSDGLFGAGGGEDQVEGAEGWVDRQGSSCAQVDLGAQGGAQGGMKDEAGAVYCVLFCLFVTLYHRWNVERFVRSEGRKRRDGESRAKGSLPRSRSVDLRC